MHYTQDPRKELERSELQGGPQRDTALFWNAIWVQCGRPSAGPVASIRRKTRAEYHRSVMWVREHSQSLESERMTYALNEIRSRDFWKEVKKLSRSSKSLPSTVDNACDEESFAQLFASKYQTLYNQISYDDNEMEHLTSDLDRLIAQNDCSRTTCTHQTFVSPDEAAAAARHLNHGKKDGSVCSQRSIFCMGVQNYTAPSVSSSLA